MTQIVFFGLKTPTSSSKSDKKFPKYVESIGLGKYPKNLFTPSLKQSYQTKHIKRKPTKTKSTIFAIFLDGKPDSAISAY